MKINNVQIRLQKIINKANLWPRKYFPLAVVRTRFLVLYYNKGQRADRTLEERLYRGGGGGEWRHLGVDGSSPRGHCIATIIIFIIINSCLYLLQHL